jgi:hypothetical protein
MSLLLEVCGAIALSVVLVWPIADAILFGILATWQIILNAGWKSFKPKYWWWLIRNPWIEGWSRLFGVNRYSSEIQRGDWRHVPPFKLYRCIRSHKIKCKLAKVDEKGGH